MSDEIPVPPAPSSAGAGASSALTNKARVLTLTIKDKSVLFAAYMSFLEEGGLFIPTNKTFTMGEPVALLLSLMEESEKMAVDAKVVWLTPKGSQGNRAAGIGVEFSGDTAKDVRDKIEGYLAGTLKTERPTYTM